MGGFCVGSDDQLAGNLEDEWRWLKVPNDKHSYINLRHRDL